MDSVMIADKVDEPVADENEVLDVLNRREFVTMLIDILDYYSKHKKSCSFAIDGQWGAGKTFVIDMLEKQMLQKISKNESYIIFHYNCWHYDYYDEPIVAIVSAMLDYAQSQNTISDSANRIFDLAIKILSEITGEITKNLIGFNLVETSKNILKRADKKAKKGHEHDPHFAFKKTLEETKKCLSRISKDNTLIIIVDELDRCLPQYAIKVLERLHHIFDGLVNTVIVMAVDRKQLDESVKQIFGVNVNVSEYLKKFIDFEIHLDNGTVNDNFHIKHADYMALFDESKLQKKFSLDDYFSAVFDKIDPRTQENIVRKAALLHSFVFGDEKPDYAVMCVELLWLVLIQWHGMTIQDKGVEVRINLHAPFGGLGLSTSGSDMKIFSFFKDGFGEIEINPHDMEGKQFIFKRNIGISELIIWYLNNMFDKQSIRYLFKDGTTEYMGNLKKLREFNKLAKLIS